MRDVFPVDKFKISVLQKEEKSILAFYFPNDFTLRKILQQYFPMAKWSSSSKYWWIYDTSANRQLLGWSQRQFDGAELKKRMSVNNAQQFEVYLDQLVLLGYSNNTVKTYATEFAQFIYILKEVNVQSIAAEQLRSYMLYCIKELKMSENQIHSRLNALKFYFEQVLGREKFFYQIPRPQKKSSLPKVLSTNEIIRLFDVTTNNKHQMMLKICYGMGLRVSELVNLRIVDVDSDRMMVHIQSSKNKKDRYVPLPQSILEPLRDYYIAHKPKTFLFEGKDHCSMAIRSIQSVFKQAMNKAKIKKKIGIHGLRHSYATHLLEYGTDMSFIQKLLGHQHISTTEIYAHVTNKVLAKVKSPLDRLQD